MNWNDHSKLKGSHAFLSASKPGWENKTNEELLEAYKNSFATTIGTLLHSYAEVCIDHHEKLNKSDRHGVKIYLLQSGVPEFAIDLGIIFPTLMSYVNDAIGFGMDPEVVLWYSDLCYGTADSIQFRNDILRIHDLKTGVTPAKMEQLMKYAALFFLEYGYKPEKVSTQLRIYQSGEVLVLEPTPDDIHRMMHSIVEKDAALQEIEKF